MPDIEISRYSIETWIKTIATGEFHYKNVMGLERVLTPKEDNKLRGIIFELCKANVCETIGRRDGYYRPIQDIVAPLDFSATEEKTEFPVLYPFGLRKWVFIYPNTASIVAGAKSSGKTGWLYRTIALNMSKINTVLLSNMEGGKEQMYDRFLAMGIDLKTAGLQVYEVFDNFHDFIKEPNTLYVIDYIDAPEGIDFYLIGAAITKVRRKLVNSHALIGLQKPASRDIAFGGDQTLKEAAMYIALNSNKLKIVDAKVPADKTLHPKNMQWTFTYSDEGTTFNDIKPYYGE